MQANVNYPLTTMWFRGLRKMRKALKTANAENEKRTSYEGKNEDEKLGYTPIHSARELIEHERLESDENALFHSLPFGERFH